MLVKVVDVGAPGEQTLGITSKLAALSAALAFALGALPAWSETASARWKVSIMVHQTAQSCDGGRGFIKVVGTTLSAYNEGMPYPSWEVKLEADGSANKVVGSYIHSQRLVRVKVAPGTGPREVTALYEDSLCGFKYVSD